MRSPIRAFALALALLWSSLAISSPVIVGIEGYISAMNIGGVDVGDPVRAFYVYDSEATGPSSPPGTPNPLSIPTYFSQSFQSTGFPYGVFGTVGSKPFAIPNATIQVTNDSLTVYCSTSSTQDWYLLESNGGVSGFGGGTFGMLLVNCDGTAYDAANFPLNTPPVPVVGAGPGEFYGLTESAVFYDYVDGSHFGGWFVTTKIYLIPEPSTLMLLGLGLAGLAFTGRRQIHEPTRI